MAVSKRFGRFKDEDEQAVRAPDVAEDRALGQLKEAWMKVRWAGTFLASSSGRHYPACMEAIAGLAYSPKDVEKFSLALAEYQDTEDFSWKAGYFLSALINNCPESKFAVYTRHLDRRIVCLGVCNTKDIMMDGDAGNFLGYRMLGGRITVNGNTDDFAGRWMVDGEIVINGDGGNSLGDGMQGGKITVKGNVGYWAGQRMKKGEIVVNGNSGHDLGDDMQGGKIVVEGYAGWVGVVRGGEIYHKGKRIYWE
jgi:hypothetical protein